MSKPFRDADDPPEDCGEQFESHDKKRICDLKKGHPGNHYGWPIHTSVDAVNHPPHYTSHPSGVECITVTEHMNFCIGNAVKYLWRADLKNGLEDLEKAEWYVRREIERRKRASC